MAGKKVKNEVYAVILAGGKGKRLKPLSTSRRPKAFLSVTKDDKSMFRRTVERIKKFVPQSHIVVVANRMHASLVKKDFLKLPKKNLILEPVSRNTAPAVALAAARLKTISADAIMAVFPTDQYIIDEAGYVDSIKEGINFARDNNALLIFTFLLFN